MSESDITTRPKPVVLIVLDGWGVAPPSQGNAITRAKTPNFDFFTREYFTTTLQAAGEAVGLKWGEVGNSEVGHLNIGSGKVIFQPQPRIDKAIVDGSFTKNEALLNVLEVVKDKQALHIVGLVSDTGVHSTIEHLYALLELAKKEKVGRLFVHVILDGRDAPYNSGLKYIGRLNDKMEEVGIGKIATISGRFWAMDRNNNWNRIEKAYRALVDGQADQFFTNPADAVRASYQNDVYDEQFIPAVAIGEDKKAIGNISDGDAVIFFNFRADRARQLAKAIAGKEFVEFERRGLTNIHMVTFTEYDSSLPVKVAFPASYVKHPLAEIISGAGLKQLHVAETEKYAHVTYFLNGGREKPFAFEERELLPSPPVTSYEEKPEMSALDIREKIVAAVESGNHDLVVINFANADMVGHTGNMEATMRAVEVLDLCLGTISKAVLVKDGVMIVTADHGNAEKMMDLTTGQIDKEHTSLPVPFIIIGNEFHNVEPFAEPPDLSQALSGGILSDVAPTILAIMGLPKPSEMTGRSLI